MRHDGAARCDTHINHTVPLPPVLENSQDALSPSMAWGEKEETLDRRSSAALNYKYGDQLSNFIPIFNLIHRKAALCGTIFVGHAKIHDINGNTTSITSVPCKYQGEVRCQCFELCIALWFRVNECKLHGSLFLPCNKKEGNSDFLFHNSDFYFIARYKLTILRKKVNYEI